MNLHKIAYGVFFEMWSEWVLIAMIFLFGEYLIWEMSCLYKIFICWNVHIIAKVQQLGQKGVLQVDWVLMVFFVWDGFVTRN
jgi:hypothetical protein